MHLPANEKRMLVIASCASFYWAATILLTMTWKVPGGSLGLLGSSSAMIMPVSVCTIIAFWFARGVFFKRSSQLILAGSIVASTTAMLCIFALGLISDPLGRALASVLPGYCSGCSIVFWGLNFASLSKDESEKTVFMTLVFTFILYLAGSAVPVGDLGYYATEAMKALAVLPFLFGCYELSVVEREQKADVHAILPSFVASRCFFGVAIGIVVSMSAAAAVPTLSAWLLVPCVALLAVAVRFLGKESKFSSYLRVAPLLVVVPLALPYVGPRGCRGPLGKGPMRSSGFRG